MAILSSIRLKITRCKITRRFCRIAAALIATLRPFPCAPDLYFFRFCDIVIDKEDSDSFGKERHMNQYTSHPLQKKKRYLKMLRLFAPCVCALLLFAAPGLAEGDDSYFDLATPVLISAPEAPAQPDPTAEPEEDYDTVGEGALPPVENPDAVSEQAPAFPRTFVITVGGDTTLGSTDSLRQRDDCFENVVAQNGYDWPFSGLLDLFSQDDLTLVNFEGTLTESEDKKDKKFNFKAPAEYAQILQSGSVEAVNIANNHIVDYGDQGKEDTIANLKAYGLTVSGGGMLGIYESGGVKVGMTGYCFPYYDSKKDISKDVAQLREAGCQIVIASFHWGSEYSYDFTAEQRSIGRAAIRAGADVVIGHHPHVAQGIERYNDTYILYSLGNLVFGGNVDPDDRDAYVARLTFTVTQTDCSQPELEIIPIRLTELSDGTDYRPIVAGEEDAERIRKKILRKSYKMEDE